jgi:putative phosphoesterase
MKIAVLSDCHDQLGNLQAALAAVRAVEAERLFFLGDFCAPFTLDELAKGFRGPIDAVFGNNDGDAFLLCRIASRHPHVTLHGHFAELEIASRRVALHHYPDVAHYIAASERFDAVFSGHDHQRYVHSLGRTLWANPGEIMGRFGTVSFGIYDTDEHSFSHHEVVAAAAS